MSPLWTHTNKSCQSHSTANAYEWVMSILWMHINELCSWMQAAATLLTCMRWYGWSRVISDHVYKLIQESHVALSNTHERIRIMTPLSMHTKVSHVALAHTHEHIRMSHATVINAYQSESCQRWQCIQKWVMSLLWMHTKVSHVAPANTYERVVSLLATHTNGSRHTDKHTRTRHVTPAYTLSLFLVLSLHPPLPLSLLRSLFFLWDTHTQTHT